MYILGAGAAYPTTLLDRDMLVSLMGEPRVEDLALLSRIGTTTIATVLNLEYLRRTGNPDVLDAWKNSSQSPTDLGVAAARNALSAAGLTMDQVGLVIGTTSTPYQTCPSEAQRITGKLGVKIPCYDIIGGLAAVPLYIETLMSWKLDRIPQYVLCVFTDTPTQHIKYSAESLEPFVFGDAASAMVLSANVPGKLRIVTSHLRKNPEQRPVIEVDRRVRLRTERVLPSAELIHSMAACLSKLEVESSVDRSKLHVVAPELLSRDCVAGAPELGIDPANISSSAVVRGYSMGSAPLCALADLWPNLKRGDRIAMLHGGDGVWNSGLMCECE